MRVHFEHQNKAITGHGTIELIENRWIEFKTHPHTKNPVYEYFKDDAEAFENITKEKKYPIICFVDNLNRMDKKSEKFMRSVIKKHFLVQAIVTKNKWTVFTINTIIKVMGHPIPMQLFTNKTDAKKWMDTEMSKINYDQNN